MSEQNPCEGNNNELGQASERHGIKNKGAYPKRMEHRYIRAKRVGIMTKQFQKLNKIKGKFNSSHLIRCYAITILLLMY